MPGGSLALQSSPRGHSQGGIKSTRKWPAGGIAHWTLPILKRMAKHYPRAVDRIGEILDDPEHKDNFAACKLVIETLVQDEHVKKGMIEGGEIKITIQLADQTRIVKDIQAEPIHGEATEVTA